MRVLVCGARGFIGQQVVQRLRAQGHEVISGVSREAGAQDVLVDYARDVDAAAWLPRLQGVDAVVNAVGVLRDSAARPIRAVHETVPQALWAACAQAGVGRVVQVSALGVDSADTVYAQTKRAADAALLALQARGALSAAVVRPSVVFGRGGDSSALFMNLARLPVLVLPAPMVRAQVQPVSVHDLADVLVGLLAPAHQAQGVLTAVGATRLSMADLVASLRQQLGHGRAPLLPMPMWMTRLSARAGDFMPPQVPWCSETLAMLGQDNVGDGTAFESVLGRAAVGAHDLVAAAWG